MPTQQTVSTPLMIGISGVRGIVGKSFTPELALRFATAFGTLVQTPSFPLGRSPNGRASPIGGATAFSGVPPKAVRTKGEVGKIVVGLDSRPSGEMIKSAVIAGLTSVGCEVVDLGIVPTPTVQIMVEDLKADGGIVITASHNPIEWNAFKFIGPGGAFLNAEEGRRLLEIYQRGKFKYVPWDKIGKTTMDDSAIDRHICRILAFKYLSVQKIRQQKFKVVIDCNYGAAGELFFPLLNRLECRIIAIGLEPTGQFSRLPEPVAKNLSELCETVQRERAAIGFATDADGDRLSIVSDKGIALGEEYTLALATRYILSKVQGTVVTNLSTTRMIDDIALESGVKVIRTRVGEANVVQQMQKEKAVIGGEGNGGVILPEVHYGRDGAVAMALVLQLITDSKKTISELAKGFPKYYMIKRTLIVKNVAGFFKKIEKKFFPAEVDHTEGIKLNMSEAWIHLRASGTEPILRLIIEAKTKERLQEIHREITTIAHGADTVIC
ncbi:MAG: phosphoglucosamine mutase [Candidatus Edwardsbacteria bacterium]